MGKILLQCPCCGKSVEANRELYDPPNAEVLVTSCPDCWDGDFGEVKYLREDGTVIELRDDLERM